MAQWDVRELCIDLCTHQKHDIWPHARTIGLYRRSRQMQHLNVETVMSSPVPSIAGAAGEDDTMAGVDDGSPAMGSGMGAC